MTCRIYLISIAAITLGSFHADAAVRLTALQIISSDTAGKIQGVGAHRFKTANHGGQPCIFVVDGDDIEGAILNGPDTAHNGIDIPLAVGTHSYTVYAENANSYKWSNYTINLFFDQSSAGQISALVPLNVNSTQFFPPFSANQEFTENLQGASVKAPNTLLYKSGQTEVTLTGFHFSSPELFKKDRVGPFEAVSDKTLDYVGQFTLEVKAPPTISAGGLVNAASFTAKVAPGSLFSVFGSDLATGSQSAVTVPLSTSLAGTSVTVGGKAAPLVFVSPTQVNAQIPYEVAEGSAVPVVVTVDGTPSAPINVTVSTASPGIFQFGNKRAVLQNEDYSVNNTDNGAAPGTYAIAYLTGSGALDHPVPTGDRALSNPLSRPAGIVSATINNAPVEVLFGGLTPDYIGLMQVNFKMPSLPPGSYPLVVTINGQASNAAMVTVKSVNK